MDKLYEILVVNLDIVQEIGWDLPELFLKYFDLEWDYKGSLVRDTELIKSNMRNFDLVAKNGNPKELFLKSIELLAEIDDADVSTDKAFKILDIKVHTLIELLSTSLKRINTIYPSRFLSMAIASLLRLFSTYTTKTVHLRFAARRLYSFARDYIPPLKPSDYLEKHGITQQEAQKIEDDENFLQRKLLQSFLTQLSEICFTNNSVDFSVELYKNLQYRFQGKLPPTLENDEELYTSTRGLFSRITQLTLSFDMDLENDFEKIKKDSLDLLSKVDLKKDDDEKIQDILKLAINDKISHLYHPETKEIPMSPSGELFYITHYAREISQIFPITFHEALAITLRNLSPGLIAQKFQTYGSVDTSLFWCWASMINSKQSDFIKIPNHELILFLQIIIFYGSISNKPSIRLVAYTLLTRVLTYIDEKTCYNFLIDTLTTAPFLNAKAAVVTILKDLILRVKVDSSIDSLNDALKTTKIDDDDDKKKEDKPEIPTRHYIELNNSRIEDIYALIRESIDETFQDDGNLNSGSFKVTLSYLNLLITIKEKFPIDKLQKIIEATETKLEKFTKYESEDPTVNIGFISITLDSLKTYLKEKST